MQELFVSADCSNAAKDHYQKCINESVDTLIGIKSVEDKQKLQLLCWFVRYITFDTIFGSSDELLLNSRVLIVANI